MRKTTTTIVEAPGSGIVRTVTHMVVKNVTSKPIVLLDHSKKPRKPRAKKTTP